MAETSPATIGGFEVVWEPPTPVNGVSGPPDILLQGSDEKLVKAHKSILSFSTEMFNAVLSMDVDETAVEGKLEGWECLRLDKPGGILQMVIPFCYNIPGPDLSHSSFSDLLQAYGLAHRFTALRSLEKLGYIIVSRCGPPSLSPCVGY